MSFTVCQFVCLSVSHQKLCSWWHDSWPVDCGNLFWA